MIIWGQDSFFKKSLFWYSQQVARKVIKPPLSNSGAYSLFTSFFWIFRLIWNSRHICLSLSYTIISLDRYVNNTRSFGLHIQAIKDLWDRICEKKKVEILYLEKRRLRKKWFCGPSQTLQISANADSTNLEIYIIWSSAGNKIFLLQLFLKIMLQCKATV